MKKKRKNQPKKSNKGKTWNWSNNPHGVIKTGVGGLCLRLNAILEKGVTVAFIGDIASKILTRIIRL